MTINLVFSFLFRNLAFNIKTTNNMENYQIITEIRIEGEKPKKIPSEKTLQPRQLEDWMRDTFIEINHVTPVGADINIEAYLYNSISGTYMNMASYYGSEKRFVKH